jgi:hypothetical protein
VTGNRIWTAGQTGVSDGPGTSLILSNNTIQAADVVASGNGSAIAIGTEPGQVTGNYLWGPTGMTITYSSGVSTGGMITGNLINGYYAGGSSSAAIHVSNSSVVANPDWTAIGNTLIAARATSACFKYENLTDSANFINGANPFYSGPGFNQCATSISP